MTRDRLMEAHIQPAFSSFNLYTVTINITRQSSYPRAPLSELTRGIATNSAVQTTTSRYFHPFTAMTPEDPDRETYLTNYASHPDLKIDSSVQACHQRIRSLVIDFTVGRRASQTQSASTSTAGERLATKRQLVEKAVAATERAK